MKGHPTLPGLTAAAPPIDEATLQRDLKSLFAAAGAAIYDRSQGYRKERGGTRMTPGLADLELHFPRIRRLAMFEVKTEEGLREHARLILLRLDQVPESLQRTWKRAKAQEQYRARCRATDTPYGIGGFQAAWALLIGLGLARKAGQSYVLTPQGGSAAGDREGAARSATLLSERMLQQYEEAEAIRHQVEGQIEVAAVEDPELEAFLMKARERQHTHGRGA